MQSRKAQSQTIIWVGATIVIIVFSLVYLFAVGAMAKVKGVGFEIEWISGGDSGVKSQQMLFALLSKDSGKIMDLIEQEEFSETHESVKVVLDEFSEMGVECKFELHRRFVEGEDSGGKMVSIEIGEEEVRLTC